MSRPTIMCVKSVQVQTQRGFAALLFCFALTAVSPLHAQDPKIVDVWRTNADRSELMAHQRVAARAGTASDTITVDAKKSYQSVDGFGFAMTGGSAQLLHKMSAARRHEVLQRLFGRGPNDLGVSYLRVSIGASDMNDHVYTYDDMPAGQTDPSLAHFTLAEDEADVIPMMKEVLSISPKLQILASPWTPPSWMKTNDSAKGGTLQPEFYSAYAAYLVRYLQAMQAHGVPITALTMQNEPLNPKNTPSLMMEAPDEAAFLSNALGPALHAANLKTKVVLFDHNCNHPDYPLTILQDPKANEFADGSGFHLYEGEISAMSQVHDAFPSKNLYFTEQMVIEEKHDGKPQTVAMPVSRIVVGAMRNWSRTVLLWNLAADPNFGPHTNEGGCPICQGAITIDGDKETGNIALYTIAHVSKFVPTGSVRIDSSAGYKELNNVAWRTPFGKYVLLVTNTGDAKREFNVSAGKVSFAASLEAGSVATFVW